MSDNFTHKVTVELNPKLEFTTQEEYSFWDGKIAPVFKDKKLWGFDVYLTINGDLSNEEIQNLAHGYLEPLISRLSFEANVPINYSLVSVENISKKSRVGIRKIVATAMLVKPIPMPKPESVDKMSFYTKSQMFWFKAGLSSQSVIGKITSFYKVLEWERNTTRTNATPYKIEDEFRFVRNAVSHPTITDEKTKKYLLQNIGQDFIEPHNPKHIKFLWVKEKLIEEDARRILTGKI